MGMGNDSLRAYTFEAAANADDTKSPLVNPHSRDREGYSLSVHFYHLDNRSPRWLRAIWWPRPVYGHCCIEWGPYIHNMAMGEGAGFHHKEEFLVKNPPYLTTPMPGHVSFDEAQRLVRRFTGKKVQRLWCALWHLRIRLRVPMTCALLVAEWLDEADTANMPHGGIFMRPLLVTPDQIHRYTR